MAHEIGHPMGLADCDTCAASDSVMGPLEYNPNDPNLDIWNLLSRRPFTPTQCDNDRLKQSNYYCAPPVNTDNCTWNSLTCVCDPIYGGGGGYSSDDGGGYGGSDGGYSGGCPPGTVPHYWVEYVSWDGGQTWQQVGIPSSAGCFFPGSGGLIP